jgi:hypothetical protein
MRYVASTKGARANQMRAARSGGRNLDKWVGCIDKIPTQIKSAHQNPFQADLVFSSKMPHL